MLPSPGLEPFPEHALPGLIVPHEGRGYAYAPSFVTRMETPRGPITISTNERGLRDDPLVAGERGGVLALGDSFTAGWGIDAEDAWPAQLERMLADETAEPRYSRVVNGGISGYGLRQMRLLAEELVPDLEPEVLVVGIYASRHWRVKNPYVYHEGFAVTRKRVPHLRKSERGFLYSPFSTPALQAVDFWLDRHFHLGAHLLKAPSTVIRAIRQPRMKPQRPSDPERVAALLEPFRPELEALGDLASRSRFRLLVLTVNHQLEVGSFTESDALYNSQIREWCAELGIEVVDPLPTLRRERDPILRLGDDHHWSPVAHRIAARLVLEVLLSRTGSE